MGGFFSDFEPFRTASSDRDAPRRYDVHGGWVKDIVRVKEWFDDMLRTRLYPCLRGLFPNAAGDGFFTEGPIGLPV